MAWKHLGEQFDIHGGGIDLVFPHHENELAQSCCAFHKDRMANVWMHNGFLQVEGEKMSKSLGNFVTIRELLTDWRGRSWPGDALRFAMMQTHYRSPIDWSLAACDNAFNTLKDFFSVAAPVGAGEVPASIVEALADDLNTPKVVAELHALRKQIAAPVMRLRWHSAVHLHFLASMLRGFPHGSPEPMQKPCRRQAMSMI
jgi:cysteinyl-tRNA synthetase